MLTGERVSAQVLNSATIVSQPLEAIRKGMDMPMFLCLLKKTGGRAYLACGHSLLTPGLSSTHWRFPLAH